MSQKTWLILSFIVGFVVLIGGLIGLIFYYENLPENLSQHETIILGQSRLVPGSTAAMRVLVRDSRDATPLPNSSVKVLLRPAEGGQATEIFEGTTDDAGNVDLSFNVPEDAETSQTLIVETQSNLGSDRMEQSLTLARDYRVLLSTDKPLYQPGQIIHIRALALGSFDMRPAAEQDLEVAIADGKGNTVFRKTLRTSAFGVAATDFQLASEVNSGPYKITATLGNTSSEKTVTVEHYVLPKFEVTLSTDRTFYQPGEHVEGTLTARYFFGKDVTGGEVVIEGYTFDFERVVAVTLQGTTDEDGTFAFTFDLPEYIAGSELEGGAGRFYLQASVTDQAEHIEVKHHSLPVAQNALVIEAIPESGQLRPGVENILYVMTSFPDGAPAETTLTVEVYETGERLSAETGAYGLAEVHFTPSTPYTGLWIEARDAAGATASQEFYFEGEGFEETVLLRPDAPIYRVGDTMQLSILSSQQSGTVYLDIVREGQTVSTRAVDIEGGKAEIAVDLTPELYGTLELHAYKILRSGSITRDTRLVVVDEADTLSMTLTPGADSYRPGEDASLAIGVNGTDGAGVQAALGIAIVDESVFALAEQDPGFAKLYFMLEQELLQPKYELHGFSIPDMLEEPMPVDDPELREARAGAGKAALASAASLAQPFSLNANSHQQAMDRVYEKQTAFFSTLSSALYGLFLLIPLAVIGLNGVAVWRDKRFWRSIGLALGATVPLLLVLAGLFWILSLVYWRLADILGVFLLAALGLFSFVGLIGLIVIAVKDKDRSLGMALALLPVLIALVPMLVFATERGDVWPSDVVILLGIVAATLVPLAFMLRAASFALARRVFPGIAALGVSLAFLLGAGVIVMAAFFSMGGGGAMAPMEQALDAAPVGAPMPAGVFEEAANFGMVEKEAESENRGDTAAEGETQSQGAEAPRLRQYFPETMLWLPDEVTDESGALQLDFPVADSITTWRVSALASSQDGRLGSATGSLHVFQDFFIDLDLPGSLTVGDEVAIPVGVFNYLPDSQTVRLELKQERWFELLDEPVKELEIASNDITVVYFRVRALNFGRQPFQVTAIGSQMSDAIRKDVRVFPDGKELLFSFSDKLSPTVPVQESVTIPADAIPGTQKLTVKIYPGIVSQVVEGLDALLRMPYGCFEQTSSATYPNILVMDYLKTTGQASPEVQMKAEQYINLGYQRLTTFEVGRSGGFSLFGDAPADPMLTAYGLQEFGDMSRVYNVDPALIQRIAEWLFGEQKSNGSWAGREGFHETTLTNQTGPLPVTSYIVWGLADAGYADDPRTERGASFLRESASQAEQAYTLALVANALVAVDVHSDGGLRPATEAVLDRLAEMAIRDGDSATWESGGDTYMGGSGMVGDLETTALAALALLRADWHPDLANAALTTLVKSKDSFGTWHTTSATVMALKALLESVRSGAEDVNATVTVTLNGEQTKTVQVTPETFDVVNLLTFDDIRLGDANVVAITVAGEGNLMYQVAGSYYLSWDKLPDYPELVGDKELVSIDVSYDRTELSVNDTVGVDVVVMLNEPGGVAESAIVDLGLPPGFTVEAEDLAAQVARFNDVPEDYAYAKIERFELTGRQIIIYVTNLSAEEPLAFSYRLRAKFPLVAQTPASSAYDYYNPDITGEESPQMLTVVGGEE